MVDKKGKLSRRDWVMLKRYLDHFEAMPKDVQTEQEVLEEVEWLVENGFCYWAKKGVPGKTKKGKELMKIIDQIEKQSSLLSDFNKKDK